MGSAPVAVGGPKPRSYTQADKNRFFDALERWGSVTKAARDIGIPRPTGYDWARAAGFSAGNTKR
ncbi:helix-turn-helix domain-containing protein [Paeniglutamicibacter gangotriensis]|uniref:Transposase n=1 Tax=Paeniglutamicibacter gangotriensis Lz1y TaxID=1276920 RepID=M7NCL2_9MICC|nr:LysR family transcriptional regulator [Paeniglutamicibacter gangotriensis]EMQ99559.1 hypothetical protein ADIAG_00659 [Paeniglutamicibacter gangotriensis Lz1y]